MSDLRTEIDLKNVKRLTAADARFSHPDLRPEDCEIDRSVAFFKSVYLDGLEMRQGVVSATRVGTAATVAALTGELLEMRDVIRIRPRTRGDVFALNGDGGKLVRLRENGKVIGAIFASGKKPERFAYIIPAATLLAARP